MGIQKLWLRNTASSVYSSFMNCLLAIPNYIAVLRHSESNNNQGITTGPLLYHCFAHRLVAQYLCRAVSWRGAFDELIPPAAFI